MALDESNNEVADEFSLAVVAIREHDDDFWKSGEEIGQAADDVVGQLNACGAHPVWIANDTTLDGVRKFIGVWQRRSPITSSILYWVGHGSRDGNSQKLVTSETGPRPTVDDALVTGHLAEYLREDAKGRGNLGKQSSEAWTLLILDTCAAGVGLSNLGADLMGHKPTEPKHLLVVSTTDAGTGYLGGFNAALAKAIDGFTTNDRHIPVRDLVTRLMDALDDRQPSRWGEVPLHALIHNPRWKGRTVTGPIDAVEDPAALAASRPGIEATRWFTQREAELALLREWLASPSRSLQVITGPAGSGKSALMQSFLKHLDGDFDVKTFATGETIHSLTRSIAAELFGEREIREPELLLRMIAQSYERPFRIAVDALDEAIDPHVTAATLLRPLAQMDNVKLLVSTRTSLAERYGDADSDDRGILEALGSPAAHELVLGPDRELTRAYVRHYLGAASADPEQMERIAARVADREQPLLFARLVVTELLAGIGQNVEETSRELIDGDIATAFSHARARVAAAQPPVHALLRTLAFAGGRGFPRVGDIWLTAARALHPGEEIGDDDIRTALMHRPREASQVAPYIMLDAEHNQGTYRLSHRSFLEQFERTEEELGSALAAHTRIARALLASVIDADEIPPYVARYLPWHLAQSEPDAWQQLATHPAVLDRLVPSAVAAEAMNVAAEHALPPEILGLVASRHRVVRARPDDREGLRQVGTASCVADGTYARPADRVSPGMAWSVRSAVLRPHPIHMTLQAGAQITSLACLDGAEGVCLLAAGCRDGTVWLWDAFSGEPFGDPIAVSDRRVLAIAAVASAGDTPAGFVVGDAGGRIRLWDTLAREPVDTFDSRASVGVIASFRDERGEQRIVTDGEACAAQVWSIAGEVKARFEDHSGDVCALAVPLPGKQTVVASAGKDDAVRLWDPATGKAVGEPLEHHLAWVKALARFEDREGRDLLASGGDDETILIWDISEPGSVPGPLRIEHPGGRVGALCTHATDDGAVRLVSGGRDGTVRVWDPVTLAETCAPLGEHAQAVTALALCGGEGVPPRVASTAEDDQACIWNPALARAPGAPRKDAFVGVTALATWAEERVILSGGDDGFVRRWDRGTGAPAGEPLNVCSGPVPALVVYRDASGVERAASADGDVVLLWRSDDPRGSRVPLYGHEKPVRVLHGFASADGTQLLASGDEDSEIRLWNATTGEAVGNPVRARGAVFDIATYASKEGDTRLVPVGERTILAWSLTSPEVQVPLGDAASWVVRAATFATLSGEPRLVTGSAGAAKLRLWDPERAKELDRLDCGDEPMLALAVSVGGGAPALIAGGDEGGTIWIWSPLEESPWHRSIPLELPIRSLLWCGEDLLVGTAEGHAVLDMSSLREHRR
jgi:WD40 repeat protein